MLTISGLIRRALALQKNLIRHAFGKQHDFRLYCGYLVYKLSAALRGPLHVSHGGSQPRTDKVCVFSVYQPNGIPETVYYLLNAIRGLGYSLFIVSNTRIREPDLQRLTTIAWRVDERPNVGRDFGGYKHGVSTLLNEEGETLRRLIVANDSVFGPLHPLEAIYEEMERRSSDYWGINENLEFGNHVASYFLVFKERVIQHEAFRTFWRRYAETSSRRHAIRKGEIGLNQALRARGFRPGVYCSSASLIGALSKVEDRELFRLLYTSSFHRTILELALGSIKPGSENAHLALVKEQLIRYATAQFERSSASHTFAVIMNRFLGAPFLKRDVVMRNEIELGYLLSNIDVTTDFPEEDIEYELRVKGTVTDLSLYRRILWSGGYI